MHCSHYLKSSGKWEISLSTIRNQKLDKEAFKFLGTINFHTSGGLQAIITTMSESPDFLELIYTFFLDNIE